MSYSVLPKILAGPIVRKATSQYVFIWIATSKKLRHPQIELFLLKESGQKIPIPAASDATPLFEPEIGKRLFIYLLRVRPSSPSEEFPTDQVIGYDIVESKIRESEKPETKSILSEISRKITLEKFFKEGFKLPTILIQGPKSNLQALYGSCRKFGGPDEDMMIAAYDIINKAGTEDRPSTLFLTGDQIYADDVPCLMINQISAIGKLLMGPLDDFIGDDWPKHVISLIPVNGRGKFLDELVTDTEGDPIFTSTDKDNHLMTFGDFAATYLLSWNYDMWSVLRLDLKEMLSKNCRKLMPELRNVELAKEGAKYARKVLANMITYMIFDDHDVTDDWFFDSIWKSKANQNDRSKHIIVNGMAAYLLFQGLGNNPEELCENRRILETIQGFLRHHKGFKAYIQAVWDFDKWSYIAPTNPPTLVLDTRTRRNSPSSIKKEPQYPQSVKWRLFDDKEKNRLVSLLSSEIPYKSGSQALILVAPSPIFNLRFAEIVLQFLQSTRKMALWQDAEGWTNHRQSIIDIFEIVSAFNIRPLIILSGDVHYGYQMTGKATFKNVAIPFLQLTSSAMKNHPLGGDRTIIEKVEKFYNTDPPSPLSLTYWEVPALSFVYTRSHGKYYVQDLLTAFLPDRKSEILRLATRFNMLNCRDCPLPDVGPLVNKANNIGEIIVERSKIIKNKFHLINPKGGLSSTKSSDFNVWNIDKWPLEELTTRDEVKRLILAAHRQSPLRFLVPLELWW